ncbi:MAG: response regulator [Bacteroidales bacterium]|nr:response regulator [Bacteroidales bacterium]
MITILIYSLIIVIVLFSINKLYNYGYNKGCRSTKELLDTNLEFQNIKFWTYSVAREEFIDSVQLPFNTENKQIEFLANLFNQDDANKLLSIIDTLRHHQQKSIKFSAKLKKQNKNNDLYAYLSLSSERKLGSIRRIVGTYCELTKNRLDNFSGIPSFENFKSLFEEIPIGVAVCSFQGIIEDINKSYCKILGIQNKREYLSKNYNINNLNYYKIPYTDILKESGRYVMLDTFDFNQIIESSRKGKCSIIYTAKVISDLKGVDHIFITVNDISSNIMYNDFFNTIYLNAKSILDSSPIGITLFDFEGKRTFVNDEFIKIMGIQTPSDFIKQHHSVWESPILGSYLQEQIANNNSAKTTIEIDFNNQTIKQYFNSNNYGIKYFRLAFQHICAEDGKYSSYIITCLDITNFEKIRRKNKQISFERDLLIELGNFISWIYDIDTRKSYYISDKQFSNLPNLDNLHINLFVEDYISLTKDIQKIIKGEIQKSRLVVRYKHNPQNILDFQTWEFLMHKLIDNNNSPKVLFACRNITDFIKKDEYKSKLVASSDLILKKSKQNRFYYEPETNKISFIDFPIANIETFDTFINQIDEGDYVLNAQEINEIKQGVIRNLTFSGKLNNGDKILPFFIGFAPLKFNDNLTKVTQYIGILFLDSFFENLTSLISNQEILIPKIINDLPCMFFVKDIYNDFRYVMVNQQYCKTLQLNEKDIIGKNDIEIMGVCDESQRYLSNDKLTVQLEEYEYDDVVVLNNKKVYLHIKKVVYTTNDNHKYIIATSLEITKLVLAIKNLEKAQKEANHAEIIKSEFLKNISHEIRTPLNSINGFSQLIINEEDSNKRAFYSNIIEVHTLKLTKLVDNVIELAKIEAGDININIENFDIAKLLNDLFVNYNISNENKNIRYIINNPYDCYNIKSDKNIFIKIIDIFMLNAIANTKNGRITLGFEIVDNNIKIFVSDTGIGIDKKDFNRIFNQFEKLNEFSDGLGLGLAIAKALVLALSGNIGFVSKKEIGSTFWFLVPIDNKITHIQFHKGDNTNTNLNKKLSGKKLLIAEDDNVSFQFLKSLFTGNNISRALNGKEAVAMARDGHFSAILLNIKIPEIDGFEATKRIRKFDSEIPIIAISGNTMASDKFSAIKAGCNDIVSKPFQSDAIIQKISQLMKM